VFSADFPSIVGHKVSLTYNMQEEEETLFRTCILRSTTSRFFFFFFSSSSSGNYACDILHSYRAADSFGFWDTTQCKLINRYLHFG
jgi:hypothetical protein